MPSISRIDQVYRSLVLSKFFSKGWGNAENMKKLFLFRKLVSDREMCQTLVDRHPHIIIDKVELEETGDIQLINGHFESPLVKHLPGLLPKVSETAHFQMVVPTKWTTPDRPVVIQMAGTGDHHFWRRRNLLARPLLKEHGIASIILENPFYGYRKPVEQRRSNLLNVADLFIMGAGLILESLALFRWCERENYGPFCLHGISMGGHMASLAATSWPKPVCLVPCLSWTTASRVFTQGVMAGAIDWKSLEDQFVANSAYRDEISKMLQPDDTDKAYIAGKDFVIQYASKSAPDPLNSNVNLKNILTFLKDRGLIKMVENVVNSLQESTSSKIDYLSTKASKWIQQVSDDQTDNQESSSSSPSTPKVTEEALHFMRGIMDECTHLKNFSVPVDPSLIIVVAARYDAYMPREGTVPIDHLWPGCEIRYVECGHITGYVLYQSLFRKTIAEAINRHRAKYYADGTLKIPLKTEESAHASTPVVTPSKSPVLPPNRLKKEKVHPPAGAPPITPASSPPPPQHHSPQPERQKQSVAAATASSSQPSTSTSSPSNTSHPSQQQQSSQPTNASPS